MAPRLPPYAIDAQRRDPRAFGPGYSPAVLQHEETVEQLRRDIANGTIPLDDVMRRLDAKNLPPQMIASSFFATIPSFGVAGAQRLIPKNPKRWGFLVANFLGSNLLMWTFDAPFNATATDGIGAGVPIGGYYQESNGQVTINDIYVHCNDPVETYPIVVLGYEYNISVSGNKR